jgi:hypothetical protein
MQQRRVLEKDGAQSLGQSIVHVRCRTGSKDLVPDLLEGRWGKGRLGRRLSGGKNVPFQLGRQKPRRGRVVGVTSRRRCQEGSRREIPSRGRRWMGGRSLKAGHQHCLPQRIGLGRRRCVAHGIGPNGSSSDGGYVPILLPDRCPRVTVVTLKVSWGRSGRCKLGIRGQQVQQSREGRVPGIVVVVVNVRSIAVRGQQLADSTSIEPVSQHIDDDGATPSS